VAEPLAAVTQSFPAGWEVNATLLVDGAAAAEVPPYSTGVVWVKVQAPSDALAGAEHVGMEFAAGGGPPLALNFTVRVPKTYGIGADFNMSSDAIGAGGSVVVEGRIEHLGNVGDVYTLRTEVDAPQYYEVEATFAAAGPGDASALVGNSLALAAFGEGLLEVTVSAPRDPVGDRVGLHITLTNQQGDTASFDASLTIVLPDLRVRFPEAPLGPYGRAGPVTVRVAVENAGDAAAGEVQVWLTLDGAVVGKRTVHPLAQNATANLEFSVNVTEGSRRLEAVVDPRDAPGVSRVYGAVYERSEENNAAAAAFTVGAPPPPPAPVRSLSTAGQPSVAWIAALAAVGGVAALVAVRLRMRRRPR